MIDESSSSSILSETISEPQTGIEPAIIINIKWFPLRSYVCRICILAQHLCLGSSMVRVSYWSSEGGGFDPRLGLRNRFSEDRAGRTFIYHLKIF